MKHLFWNDEGETVAADTLEQASRYHDCELGRAPEPGEDWSQVDDDADFDIENAGNNGETITKLASDWAAECSEATLVASTYWR